MAEAARVVYRLPLLSVFWAGAGVVAKVFCVAAMATRPIWGVADSSAFGYAVAHRQGESLYDLSAVPQRRLLPLASFRNDGFRVYARGVPAVAVSYVRSKVLCVACSAELLSFCTLPSMREFRSGAYFARPRGRWDDAVCQALPAHPGLPMRSLPGAVLQHPASPKNPSLYGASSGEQRAGGGGWWKLVLYA